METISEFASRYLLCLAAYSSLHAVQEYYRKWYGVLVEKDAKIAQVQNDFRRKHRFLLFDRFSK